MSRKITSLPAKQEAGSRAIPQRSPRTRALHIALLLASASVPALTGCGAGLTAAPTPVQGALLRGKVIGGQNPVNQAAIQVYAVGSAGYGSPAMPLLPPGSVLSQPDGTFSITTPYTCPTSGTFVYLTATGGYPGTGTTNPNLTLMSATGTCGDLLVTPFVEINEITTVGSVWALAPFMTGPANVGSSSNNSQGILNAFGDVKVLVDTATGLAPGPALPPGATVSVAEIYTLADILAACVNSNGGVAGDTSQCGTLFAAANPGGTSLTAPTDVVTAAVNIAKNPGSNVGTLYDLVVPKSPFNPTEPQPNDFTLAVNFTAGAMNAPSALAADATGNIWITNALGNSVTELSHSGAVLSGSGFTATLNQPSSIAFDLNGVAWITNKGNNTISLLNNGTQQGLPLTGGGLNQPSSIAFDFFGNAWVADPGDASVSEFDSSGTAVSSTGYTGSGITMPIGIGVSPH